MATWGTGVTKQKGSPRRNSTVPGRVKRQFMVKVKGSHSVSTSPSSGVNPSLHMLGEPRHHSAQSGSVRNTWPGMKVAMPLPKCDWTRGALTAAFPVSTMPMSTVAPPPVQVRATWCGHRSSQPVVLAIVMGVQR